MSFLPQLEWLTALPWNAAEASPLTTSTSAFLNAAQSQLDADHFGLDKIKKRLIEYLAVVRLKEMKAAEQEKAVVPYSPNSPSPSPPKKRSVKGPILLFVGPPGTGKTSLGKSIAKALERPFQRISLGGVRDEAEIRGHRRTYVASGPGLVVQALRNAGRNDAVVLL
jgi:ATP-dependent Lon protease